MKTIEQIFQERKLVTGTDFMEAGKEYGEQYRRLAKDAAFELGNANIQVLKLEEEVDKWHQAFRDLSVSHVNQGKEIHELKSKVSELNWYLEDRHKRISDLDDDLFACKERNRVLNEDLKELSNTLGLRNRSNSDLTIDEEEDDFDRDAEDEEDERYQEEYETALNCSCGAWIIRDNTVYHIADCFCGAE